MANNNNLLRITLRKKLHVRPLEEHHPSTSVQSPEPLEQQQSPDISPDSGSDTTSLQHSNELDTLEYSDVSSPSSPWTLSSPLPPPEEVYEELQPIDISIISSLEKPPSCSSFSDNQEISPDSSPLQSKITIALPPTALQQLNDLNNIEGSDVSVRSLSPTRSPFSPFSPFNGFDGDDEYSSSDSDEPKKKLMKLI